MALAEDLKDPNPDAQPAVRKDPFAGSIIDCDVHPVVPGGLNTLLPLMSKAWQERIRAKGSEMGLTALPLRLTVPNGGTAIRVDVRTPDGLPGGACPEHIMDDHIEAQGIKEAVLSSLQAGAMMNAQAGPQESVEINRAFNDYFLDVWAGDLRKNKPKLRYAMTVATQLPYEAAAEIHRIGDRPEVCAINLPMLNIPMGNVHYHPIYEAAQEKGLPILVHPSGSENVYHGPPVVAGGWPESYIERFVLLPQVGEAGLTSMVLSGTFEKFPDLKAIFVEFGCSWVLPCLWRMNKTWHGVRFDVPWVKKSPIDYVHKHVKFSTQPLDEPDDPIHLKQFIEMMGDDLLCFASDYPHWDNDMPSDSLRMLSKESRKRIMTENAKDVLRLN